MTRSQEEGEKDSQGEKDEKMRRKINDTWRKKTEEQMSKG